MQTSYRLPSSKKLAGIIIAITAITTGCAAVNPKTIIADKQGYLEKNFGVENLSAEVRSKIEEGKPIPKNFQRMEISYSSISISGGKLSEDTTKTVLTDLGGGFIQNSSESLSNGIPYLLHISLTFGNLHSLKYQAIPLQLAISTHPSEIKELTNFEKDVANPKSGATYQFSAKYGLVPALMNYRNSSLNCVTGNSSPAAQLHPNLTGTAVTLSCTQTGKVGTVESTIEYAWLSDYGIATTISHKGVSLITNYKIDSILIVK